VSSGETVTLDGSGVRPGEWEMGMEHVGEPGYENRGASKCGYCTDG
jgi:hypothetical protein